MRSAVSAIILLLSSVACHGALVQDENERQLVSTYTKCGFTSTIRHDTWYGQTFTNSPVLFPTNDEELCEIVSTAKGEDCKVRVRGAGHSEDGVVMQKLDEQSADVVVIHLKDYIPTDVADDGSVGESWNGVLDKDTDSVKVPTGWSTLELMASIRPQGYLTKTNTAGRIFSVGGAYLNPSVNGNVIEESRFASQIRSVRTMDADCNIRVYSGDEVKDWRGSVGLLGIVTAVEIDVIEDTGLTMTRSSISTESFDKEAVRAWIKEEYRNHDGVEFFYWVYEDVLDALEVDYNGGAPIDPASTQDYYSREVARNPNAALEGGTAEGLVQFTELVAGIIEADKNIAMLLQKTGRHEQSKLFDEAARLPRDGYYLEPYQVPNFKIVAINVPCNTDCVDESTDLLEATRQFLTEVKDDPNSKWYPNLPYEWRVYTVRPDEMTLEHLSPGKYVSLEMFTLRVGDDGLVSSRYLKAVEDRWRELFPNAAIHHGKGYGYQNLPGYGGPDDAVQYQDDEILDSVYTPEVQEAFKEKMLEYDPLGTFSAGSFLRLLSMTTYKFTPKQYNGDKCLDFGDSDCISGCCDRVLFNSINNICISSGDKDLDERCSESCECRDRLTCKWGPLPWEWFYACRE